eukprot:g2381.t1
MSSEIAPAGHNERRMSSYYQRLTGSFLLNEDDEILNDVPQPEPIHSKVVDNVRHKLDEFRKRITELTEEEALRNAGKFLELKDLMDHRFREGLTSSTNTTSSPDSSRLDDTQSSSTSSFDGDTNASRNANINSANSSEALIRLQNDMIQLQKDTVSSCNMIAKACVELYFEEKKKAERATMRQRCTITAFVEIADELTDYIVTIQYFTGVISQIWAGWVMIAFMIANRVAQLLGAFANHDSWKRCLEAVLGLRAITDTYYIITAGPTAMVEGSKAFMIHVQAQRIGSCLALESFPQVSYSS